MTLKTMICTGLLALSMAIPAAYPPMYAGIMDVVSDAFTKKIPAQPPSIRILLVHDKHGVILETKGKYKIYDPLTGVRVGMSFTGKRRYMQPLPDGLRWGESFPGVHQLLIVADDPATTINVDGVEYQGKIYVYDVGGSVSVINSIYVEDYLNAVLPHRYADPLPEELLAAIAITARTNCYFHTQNSGTAFWDVDALKEGYQGSALNRRSTPMEMAIYKTQYMALGQPEKGLLALEWVQPDTKRYQGITYSVITIAEASKMAQNGKNAGEILRAAYPTASLQLGPS